MRVNSRALTLSHWQLQAGGIQSALNVSTTSQAFISPAWAVCYISSAMPTPTLIVGSTVRDFCMLERNFLAHIKLVLLFSILSSSVLLGIRLPGPPDTEQSDSLGSAALPIGVLQFIAAVLTVAAALWEYHTGLDDLIEVRAFLTSTRLVSATQYCTRADGSLQNTPYHNGSCDCHSHDHLYCVCDQKQLSR